MVGGLGQGDAHQAGRGDGAVEAGERHHVDDGRHALAGLADQPRRRLVELDLGGGVGAVAELVLETDQAHAVAAAVGEVARHQKAAEAVVGLSKHQEAVARRRRQEPFVAGHPPHPAAGLARRGGGGGEVAAALFFGHAHAEGDAGLVAERPLARIVAARADARQPVIGKRRGVREGGDRGIGHGHRADVAALDLGGHVKPRRPCGSPRLAVAAVAVPGRAVQPGGDAAPHQRMVGRMELDRIDARAAGVVGPQDRRELIGDAAELEALRRPPGGTVFAEPVDHRLRQPVGERGERRIVGEQIAAGERRRLIQHIVRISR